MNIDDEFLIGGDELFEVPRFVNHYHFMLNEYTPHIEKPIAFFMSCSKHKPYNKSPYRRVFNAMIEKKLNLRDLSQVYTVSEPAIIIPEEFDETSITKYDFPPDQMKNEGRKIFVDRLTKLLPKLISAHKVCFYVLPKHHRAIFELAIENINLKSIKNNIKEKVIYAPPVTYNLPKARKVIEDTLTSERYMGKINR